MQLAACVLITARGLVLTDTERASEGEESLKKALAALDRHAVASSIHAWELQLQTALSPNKCAGSRGALPRCCSR